MAIRAAIYVRTSAGLHATADEQRHGLRQLAADRGWCVVAAHEDAGVVGGKAGQRRPGQGRLLDGIRSEMYEVVLVHSLHLLGRDLGDVITVLVALRAAGVRLLAALEGIDTAEGGTHGLFDLAMLLDAHGRFGKRERVLEGLQRARQAGVRIGRPPVSESCRKRVRDALQAGAGVREAGRLNGVSATTVLRVREQMQRPLRSRATSVE